MYYNPETEDTNNPSFNSQQFNRDKEGKESMSKDMCKCCMYYHPRMGCMYKQHLSMNPMMGNPMMGDPMMGDPMMGDPMMDDPMMYDSMMDDPMMDGYDDPADPVFFGGPFFGRPFFGRPFIRRPFFRRPFFRRPFFHFHRHFF